MLLKELTEIMGASGDEKEIREKIKSIVEPYVDNVYVDKIGNLIACKKGKKDKPKIMLAAHMDEVGLMVKSVNEDGTLSFFPVGGVDNRILVAKTVKVGEKGINGVIGAKPIHLQKRDEQQKPLDFDSLYIDIGATSKEEALKHVSPGDYVYFDSNFEILGNGYVKAKALDDRIGCNVLIENLKNEYEYTVCAAFTVEEEVGLRGAGVAAYNVEPDFAIIVEGTVAADVTDSVPHLVSTELGKGPAISLMDRTTLYDKKLIDKIAKIADENKVPYQFRRIASGGNDAGKIHLTKGGIKTIAVSVPCRYIHSFNSVAFLEDFNNTVKLVDLIIKNIEKEALI
ncbi:MAG: M42 family metallopeptidase [Thermoanaerobacter sp.]|uniref:M42 family metallopeptidase n=1 Tax=unclassified Thermoanaerobacter TaxID=2636821 RepID=UPI0000E1D93A|nr:M42 family metallopeptidase [Thermoanaerobacter sp. X514]ABY91689.1 Cellulase [Thermoanaerobacter sp. X514]KUJ90943.1 MAG: Cellulase [Thermoanaerobacter thermocopriae]